LRRRLGEAEKGCKEAMRALHWPMTAPCEAGWRRETAKGEERRRGRRLEGRDNSIQNGIFSRVEKL